MQLVMKIDYFDQVWRAAEAGEGLYDEARIEKLIRRCAATGFTTIFWRTSVCGRVSYPSKVMPPFQSEYRLICNQLAECMARFDPLAVAVEIAHRHNLRIVPWITLVDSYLPGLEDPFFARHPHLLLMDRRNRCVMRGVPCYAYPEVRQYRLAETREVMSQYKCDGVYYSSHSHNDCTRVQGDIEGKAAYGYNPPIAEAYKARYGTDPRTQDFDATKLAALRGEYLGQFLKEARAAVQAHKGTLCFDASLPEPGADAGGYISGPRGEYHIPLAKLLEDGDDFSFLFFHSTPQALAAALAGLNSFFAEYPADKRCWAGVHVGFNRSAAEAALAVWRPALKMLDRHSRLAGFTFHEAMAFEFDCPELWNFAAECAALQP